MMDVHTLDIDENGEDQCPHEVDRHSELINEKGIHRPLKDGLEDDGKAKRIEEDEHEDMRTGEDDAETSEEERELPGMRRPPRGSGWWGVGRPLQPHRKGINKDFVDGAGLPSPGRWKIRDRRLPEGEAAQDLRDTVWEALREMEPKLSGGSARATLAKLLAGGLDRSPSRSMRFAFFGAS